MAIFARRRIALTAPALAIAAAGFLVPAAAQASPPPGTPSDSSVVPVASLPGQFPESITSDRWGNMYLGLFLAGEILKITPTGDESVLATFPSNPQHQSQTLGVRIGPDGNIYAAVANTDSTRSGVWRVSPGGRHPVQIATVPGLPNGLVFDSSGNLFVSESLSGAVYRIDHHGGPARLWSDSSLLKGAANGVSNCGTHFSHAPFGANGLAFSSHGDLLVSNTTEATIVRIPVQPDGLAGPASLFVPQDCSQLWGADGMITDQWGNLYVAANAAEDIARISPRGRVQVLASHAAGDPLFTPSDVAFGPGWREQPALFISNFALAYAASGGTQAGVVKLPLGPGRPLAP